MAKPQAGLRNAAGLGLSRECAPAFYLALLQLVIAVLGLIGAEVAWRLPDLMGNYMLEAFAAISAPVLCLVVADQLALAAYQRTWFELKNLGRAVLLLDPDAMALIRRDLAGHALLRWYLPAAASDLRRQLRTAASWYDALLSPEDAPWLKRYGRQLLLRGAMLLEFVFPAVWLALTRGRVIQSASAADWTVTLLAIGVAALCLIATAVQILLITGRRQAIADYFATYQGGL